MKVLVVTLIKSGQLYGKALQTILRLSWPEQLDFLFLRGGEDGQHDDGDWKYRHAEVTRKYEYARQKALAGGYDAVFEAESDMILPEDALLKLAEVEADVVYGLYCLRWGEPRWNAFHTVQHKLGHSISETPDLAKRVWGQVIDIAGVGDGCTLIHRQVLEALPRHTPEGNYASSDWSLAEDCQRLGFIQKAHLGVVCGHMTSRPSPRVLWPDPTAAKMCRIEFLAPPTHLHVEGNKISTTVGMGQVVSIP